MSLSLRALVTSVVCGAFTAIPTWAQQSANPSLRSSRADITSRISEAEKILGSGGYSARIKRTKRQEVALLRRRLEDGDLQAGDQILLAVDGEKDLTNTFPVSAARSITLPGLGDVSLRGVLRSELEEYLTGELGKYLRNPVLHVQTTVRLTILGSVGKPGYYQIDSERTIGEALMLAGGPSTGIDPAKTYVERGGTVILDREAFTDALNQGSTLDQVNIRAGDQIVVGGAVAPNRSTVGAAIPVLSGLATLTFMLVQIF